MESWVHDSVETGTFWGGYIFGEFIFLHSYNPFNCKNTTIIGFDYAKSLIEENKKRKKGVIFFSANYGNWELGPYILNKLDLDLMGIYRKSNNTCINRIIQKYRNKDIRRAFGPGHVR